MAVKPVPPPLSSIAKASKAPKKGGLRLIRRATTQERRLRARSGTFHAAHIQDRDGGAFVTATMFGLYPFLMKLYADGGYQSPLFRRAVAKIMTQVNVEIVKRSDHAKGFVRSGGSSNERSHGLGGAGVSPKIGRISIARRSHFCASLQSGSC